ncbi:hypothetical protein V1498_11680 [Peribacillus sp. SCS-26]|uniref:hypothetical protein n=1 Tax=Paraperibacillus marinus TaxID=3115295 RepID=UPI003905BA7C
MNFEAKHLIRWGIPGWLYLTIIAAYFLIDDRAALTGYLKSLAITDLGLAALLTGLGIILGNIIHQISMLFGFIIWNKREVYFHREYSVDRIIIDGRPEVQRIYSYRLGQVHALRALTTSCILSCITLITLFYFHSWSRGSLILFCLTAILIIIVFVNQRYFRQNLDYFINKIKVDNRSDFY